ncbi:hypothetical protein ABE521_25640 [Pseudomonas sp. TWI672]|uniref:hypothetical protein n=1 Tax=unclassified Pseudomonas TaxID=196821 RepID=UPI003208F461
MRHDTTTGLDKCWAAFERLKNRAAIFDEHKNLPLDKITAGVVSIESGYDRGYLKYARPIHRRLIDEINAFRQSHKLTTPNIKNQLETAHQIIASQEKEIAKLNNMLQNIVVQNLQLVETLRTLQKLTKKTSITSIKY